ncbi:MAG: hypothetical protein ABIR84_03155 [Candidatus Nitrotoga sp.]
MVIKGQLYREGRRLGLYTGQTFEAKGNRGAGLMPDYAGKLIPAGGYALQTINAEIFYS